LAKPTKASRIETLRSIETFAGLPTKSLQAIHKVAGEIEAVPGEVLIQPRTQGSGMFIIEEGTAVVERRGVSIELGPGQCFGELSLLSTYPHTARVRAKTLLKCLTINRFDFRKLLESEPKIAISMLEMLAGRFAKSLD